MGTKRGEASEVRKGVVYTICVSDMLVLSEDGACRVADRCGMMLVYKMQECLGMRRVRWRMSG
jgi:hypothetical protein